MNNNNNFLIEMIKKQRKNIDLNNKLYLKDMQRICENINSSIFDTDECCIWQGNKTEKLNNKGYYINFYFNKKKMSLHRILYLNYIDDLNKNEYLKFNCQNKGICCNIHHFNKINKSNKINNPNINNSFTLLNNLKKIPSNNNLTIEEEDDNKLKIIFG